MTIGAWLKYGGNDKHEKPWTPGVKESYLDLNPDEAEALLNDRANCIKVPGKENYVGVKNGKIYAFKSDGLGSFHAFRITGNEVVHRYSDVKIEVSRLLFLKSPQKLEQMTQL